MRGCALALILWFGGLAALAAGFWALLHYRLGQNPQDSVLPAAAAGVLAWIGVGLFRGAYRSWSEKKLLAAGLSGAPPADGRKAALFGQLEPLQDSLIAPFDGAPAVAYSYSVGQVIGSGKSRRDLVHYRGVGLAPSRLMAASGSYQLLAVPDFEGPAEQLSHGAMLPHAEKYVAATSFQPQKASFKELEARWADADGVYRSDISYVGDEHPSLIPCTLTQRRVAPGEKVCLIGLYSAARGGIVPYPDWSERTRLIVGDAQNGARVLAGQVRTRLILAVLLSGAAGAVLWLFVRSNG
jgi:hypothetical protein